MADDKQTVGRIGKNRDVREHGLTGVSCANRGDSTPIELFLEGVRVWELGIRISLTTTLNCFALLVGRNPPVTR